jgi:hypothetical protein
MPRIAIPDTDLAYFLVAFDANGRERPDATEGPTSQRVLRACAEEPITDIFLMSHGWKGDVPAAIDQYNRWTAAMLQCPDDLRRMKERRPGFRPLLIGLHWPSLPWGDEELGGLSFDPAAALPAESWVQSYAERIANTPAARAALATIFRAAEQEVEPVRLPPEVRDALVVLDREANLGSNGDAPDADREPFDPDQRYALQRQEPFAFGLGDIGGGILDLVRQLSFWKMKDRARQFGEGGAHALLRQLLAARPEARCHLMGHSFGCVVQSAALTGPLGSAVPRPVDSLVLVQGALSLWSCCPRIPFPPHGPGYFQRLVAEQRVRGPILTTQSEHDQAVGYWYPLGAGIARQVAFAAGALPRYGAVGAFGLRGLETGVEDLEMQPVSGTYGFRPGIIYNLESSHIIRNGTGASGAHSDITHPEVAHAVWEAAMP